MHGDNANYTMKIEFLNEDQCCSIILVDFMNERVEVTNLTDNLILRAFGVAEKPSWDDFMYFLEERCIPKERFQIKKILRDLELEQYDLIRILQKTEGRTKEDEMWLRFTYIGEADNYCDNLPNSL